jgi:hypothetical protein
VAKAQINRQDTLASSSTEIDSGLPEESTAETAPRELQDEAINAPSHPVVVANPIHRAKTDAIPAAAAPTDLPGQIGTVEIHGNTKGLPFRDGDPDPEGWYGGQGGITGNAETARADGVLNTEASTAVAEEDAKREPRRES